MRQLFPIVDGVKFMIHVGSSLMWIMNNSEERGVVSKESDITYKIICQIVDVH